MSRKSIGLGNGSQLTVYRITWALRVASHYLPNTTCLAQALSAQLLLWKHGCAACFRVGIARDSSGAFQAHAWVESQGRIVSGASQSLPSYALLLQLEKGRE